MLLYPPIQKFIRITIYITLLSQIQLAQAHNWESFDWHKKKNKHGISVYTAKVENSPYVAVKTEMQVKASLSNIVSLVTDAEKCTDWVHRCYSSKIHQQVSDTEYYQYFISRLLWPLKKRDFLLHIKIDQDEDLKVSIHGKTKVGLYPEQKKLIRIHKTRSLWEFTPLDEGNIKIVGYAHIEPRIKIPKWIVKRTLVNTPYKTLRNMRKHLQENNKAPRLAFIKEKTSAN